MIHFKSHPSHNPQGISWYIKIAHSGQKTHVKANLWAIKQGCALKKTERNSVLWTWNPGCPNTGCRISMKKLIFISWSPKANSQIEALIINSYYYSFKIFPQFWLAKSTHIIHHNQLLMTKFGRILCLTRKWRQKCSLLQVNTPLTEKTWARGWVVFVVKTNMQCSSQGVPLRESRKRSRDGPHQKHSRAIMALSFFNSLVLKMSLLLQLQ